MGAAFALTCSCSIRKGVKAMKRYFRVSCLPVNFWDYEEADLVVVIDTDITGPLEDKIIVPFEGLEKVFGNDAKRWQIESISELVCMHDDDGNELPMEDQVDFEAEVRQG